MDWESLVLMMFDSRNHAVRTDRWRYIRYNDGGEELQDHESDPNEWTNLAENPEYKMVIANLAKSLPEVNVR